VSRNKLIVFVSFIGLVLLYFIVVTPNIYTSEARIVVEKSSSTAVEGNLLGLIQGGSSFKEARMLKEYIQSPAMLAELDRQFALRKHYAEPLDPLRSISRTGSMDDALRFYRRMVSVTIDEQTGLVVVAAQAFNPTYSRKILEVILQRSEAYLNRAASEVVTGQLAHLKEQVRKATTELEKARTDLVVFQDNNRLLTPQDAASPVLGAIGRLEGDLVAKRAELQAALSYLNPTSADAIKLRSQVKALQTQIASEKSRLAGSGGSDRISSSAAVFEKKKMRVEFAADVYKASITALEKAQFEAAKKSRTVVMVQPPTLPDEPSYPKPLKHIPLTLLFGYLFFLLCTLVLQVAREHR
jgi:capsular polysaccharide transport system permease protein